MPPKITTYILFLSFIHLLGCYSFEAISFSEFENELKTSETPKELFINTYNLKKYHCSGDLFYVEQDSVKIKGTLVVSDDYEEPYSGKLAIRDIESIEIESLNEVTTILFVGSIVGCTFLLVSLSEAGEHPIGW